MTRAYRSPGVACKWRPRDFTVSLLALDRRSKQGQPNAPRHPQLLQGHGTLVGGGSGQQQMKHPQGDESFAIDGEVVVVAARPRKRVTDDQRRGTRATRYCKYPPAEPGALV